MRVFHGVNELRTEGPGPVTAIQDPDPVDGEVVGNWRLVVPHVTGAEDGYGRVETLGETEDLGRLTIQSSGSYEWDVPGRVRSTGTLTEVTAQEPDAHYWTFEGNGQTLVLAPGGNGTLLVYDTGNNRYYATAQR